MPTNATDSVTPSSLDQASQLRPEDFLPMTEHIGYLKEMGLDYGWGPTSLMEWVFEHIHVWTGTPWWLSITLTALVVRAVLIKPMLGASDQAAKLQAMKPVTGPLTDKMRERQKAGDTVGVMKARSELKQVHARAGIQTWKSFIPMIQLPLGYGVFRLTRGMAALPVPGLEDGGLFWFRDLTVADPYYILPLATAILLHLAMRVSLSEVVWETSSEIDGTIFTARRRAGGHPTVGSHAESLRLWPPWHDVPFHVLVARRVAAIVLRRWTLVFHPRRTPPQPSVPVLGRSLADPSFSWTGQHHRQRPLPGNADCGPNLSGAFPSFTSYVHCGYCQSNRQGPGSGRGSGKGDSRDGK